MRTNIIIGILFAAIFFLVGLATISNYGLNWDEPAHFMRGQALLHYLQTGSKTYDNLSVQNRSQWQYDGQNGVYYLDKKTASHPTSNDILAAFTNYIFYQNFGIIGDLQSYHVFEVFTASLLIFVVYFMTSIHYGKFAGMIAALSLSLYPLFIGESHFNIKDPVETSFYGITIFLIYLAINRKKGKYIILAGISFAFAMGTKFNAAFIPFITLIYLFGRYYNEIKKYKIKIFKKIPRNIYLSVFVGFVISILLYLFFNPQLWKDPIGKFFGEQFGYYKDIGLGGNYEPGFVFHGINLYPSIFIGISTPLIILFLFLVGLFYSIFLFKKEKNKFSFIVLLWFLITILRVSISSATIYSGVRQIMEYVPAMAILCGIGAYFIRRYFSKFINTKILSLIILTFFIPLAITLIRIHPNENVFMNSLIGGVNNAVAKKIPGAGETMGNAYLQGVLWLNKNAEKGAHYKALVGLSSNIPDQLARKDLKLKSYFSGMEKNGEYLMEVLSVDFPPSGYKLEYVNKFLSPVYVYTVDGYPVLKIWKNDIEHTRKNFDNVKYVNNIQSMISVEGDMITVVLPNPVFLTRIEMRFDNSECKSEIDGNIAYSVDGKKYTYVPGGLSDDQGLYVSNLQEKNLFAYFFAAYPAKYIRIIPDGENSCLFKYKEIRVRALSDIKP